MTPLRGAAIAPSRLALAMEASRRFGFCLLTKRQKISAAKNWRLCQMTKIAWSGPFWANWPDSSVRCQRVLAPTTEARAQTERAAIRPPRLGGWATLEEWGEGEAGKRVKGSGAAFQAGADQLFHGGRLAEQREGSTDRSQRISRLESQRD